jgi:hypothetical protein
VCVQGKGELRTYWLKGYDTYGPRTTSPTIMRPEIKLTLPALVKMLSIANIDPDFSSPKRSSQTLGNKSKVQRLIDYNTRVLERYIKKVVIHRKNGTVFANVEKISFEKPPLQYNSSSTSSVIVEAMKADASFPFIVHDRCHYHSMKDSTEGRNCNGDDDHDDDKDHLELGSKVRAQLRDFVQNVSELYRDLPFHCFEHASHTILAVTKLLAAVEATATTASTDLLYKTVGFQNSTSSFIHNGEEEEDEVLVQKMTCDRIVHPMTQFAIVFAALVHDMDYEIPNTQLIKEKSVLATKYKNQSIAEQNSIDRAWSLLIDTSKYEDLRACIFTTQEDLDGFRTVVIKSVMATDLWDKKLADGRRQRWNDSMCKDSFHKAHNDVTILHDNVDLDQTTALEEIADQRAWVVLEHLIQVSDVSHTVQPLNVFLKWNKLLFKEMYILHKTGRLGGTDVPNHNKNDPSKDWYDNEIKFFDGHVIPLAERVRSCKVFGVAAQVLLTNAHANRREWIHMKEDTFVKDYAMDFRKKSAVHHVIAANVRRIPSIDVPRSHEQKDNDQSDNGNNEASGVLEEGKSNDH